MKPRSRKEALRRGETQYFTGKPCKRGHVAERYVGGKCVVCNRAGAHKWNAAHPEKERARTRAWNTAHPDHRAALVGLTGARKRAPGCVPPEFNLEETIPFYAEARRRTRETGVQHEVDHIQALCLGGLHIASNLQVLTAGANSKKAKAERARRRKKHSKK